MTVTEPIAAEPDDVPPTMRGVLLRGERSLTVTELPVPAPGPEDAVVRVRMSAVCGSDLPHYRNTRDDLGHRAHTVPGHEAVGVVVRSASSGAGPAVGTRVIVYQHTGCGRCAHCLRGQAMFCRDRQTLGNHRHGADAEYVVAPATSCLPLPADIDDAVGALIACNFGTAVTGFRKTGARLGDHVTVVGLGPVGLCVVACAAKAGAWVIGVDPMTGRRKLAAGLGARSTIDPLAVDPVHAIREATDGRGSGVVFECSANPVGQDQAMKAAAVHGTVLLLGANNHMVIDPGIDVIRKELTLLGSWVFTIPEFADIVATAREVPGLGSLLGATYAGDDAAQAFAQAAAGGVAKALIDWT